MSPKPTTVSEKSISEHVSLSLRVAAAWSWRVLIVIAALGAIGWLLRPVSNLVIACLLSLLLALLLSPLVTFLRDRLRIGNSWAAVIGLLTGMLAVAALFALAIGQLVDQIPVMVSQSMRGLDKLFSWVESGPMGLDTEALMGFLNEFQADLGALAKNYGGLIASEALTFASSAVSLATSGLIMMFVLFFLLKDGRSMWIWFLRMLPADWRSETNEAGVRGWVTLGWYIRTQLKVAGIDALGIGLGALALGVPAAIPIMVLVFLFSFIPIIGAFISGAVAVLLALVNNGLTPALIMLFVVLAVQQLESNVLQPWLMSQAVSLHPVAVVLAVTGGGAVAGIAGAVFAVPLIAFVNVTVMYLHGHDMYPQLATDPKRPGGPPGELEAQIAASYRTAHTVPRGQGNADGKRVEVQPADPVAAAEVAAEGQ